VVRQVACGATTTIFLKKEEKETKQLVKSICQAEQINNLILQKPVGKPG
jgi:hypothetical protein